MKFARFRLLFLIGVATVLICSMACKNGKKSLFVSVPVSESGIDFINRITENDSINPIDLEFLYNGGGVAVGDFNRDSLPDLYFTASLELNRLYLNQGHLNFNDVTRQAGVGGTGQWFNAATVTDINNDGWPDIYVCTTIYKETPRRTNLLYVNQGLNAEGIPVFKEMAAAYGLADTSYSVQAAFLDYDHDGDLDMYLATTRLAKREGARLNNSGNDTSTIDRDKLFRNDWNDQLKHPVFTDVTQQAGIAGGGFGLSVSVADFNNDRWPDIYVANDFFSGDALYINQHDGSFVNKIKTYFKHTSQNAMGSDAADINNDGLVDLITVDMNPEDNYRKKKNMNGANYFVYQEMMHRNMVLQYVRNTLQLNQGPRLNAGDSIGDPVFADISLEAGVAQTDWSWSPSMADFDNDGWRDILITNGYPRDVTDHDFIAFRTSMRSIASKESMIDEIPQIRIPNYAFRNTGDLKFENVTRSWGLDKPSFSSGAVYVDLDRDGDLDYVISNINEEVSLYENTLNTADHLAGGWIDIGFAGSSFNKNGIGARAELYYGGKMQAMDNQPVHGYLSCTTPTLHFGLGNITKLDSMIIRWPWTGKKQTLYQVPVNRLLTIDIRNAKQSDISDTVTIASSALFADATRAAGITYQHNESDFIDFNQERLLPHKLSQYGPGLAAGDVNRDGIDDIFIGGSSEYPGSFLLQQANGTFRSSPMPLSKSGIPNESRGVLLFDCDGDGDLDLYCVSGSNEFEPNSNSYRDLLYINNGKGKFTEDSLALPVNLASKSCVKAADYDNDGDLDLFIGGRIVPGKYAQPASSRIYRNDSRGGKVVFTDVTATACKTLIDLGMVCDAIWTDFDNDGFKDLILAGEWMPLTFFKNGGNGIFSSATDSSGVAGQRGWWNSITGCDLDQDGDIDYVVGNQGTNTFFQPTDSYPLTLYAKDFDHNGSTDPILSVYLKDSMGELREFPWASRDEIVDQIPSLKKKFLTYKSYAQSDISGLFSSDDLRDARVLTVNNMKTAWLRNDGHSHFSLMPLPLAAQLAPVFSSVTDDFNGDGYPDIALCGNDFGNEVLNGRCDAFNGLVLAGDGKGNFRAQTIMQSGISLTGDFKAMIKLKGAGGSLNLVAAEHQGPLKLYRINKPLHQESFTNQETHALIDLPNGKTTRVEKYYGDSFLSASSSFFIIPPAAISTRFYNHNKITRTMHPK